MTKTSQSMSEEELREALAQKLTGGVHYWELADSFMNDGQMTPNFPARYANDVVKDIDNIVEIFISELTRALKELKEELDDGKKSHSMAVIAGVIDNKIKELEKGLV